MVPGQSQSPPLSLFLPVAHSDINGQAKTKTRELALASSVSHNSAQTRTILDPEEKKKGPGGGGGGRRGREKKREKELYH